MNNFFFDFSPLVNPSYILLPVPKPLVRGRGICTIKFIHVSTYLIVFVLESKDAALFHTATNNSVTHCNSDVIFI